MAIFRRGAIYWWRRNPPRKSNLRPLTLRLSLRTASVGEAKARAAALEVAWKMVEAIVEQSLRPVLAIEDLSRIYHLAFKTELDRIILRQVATPMRAAGHAETNRDCARYFTLLSQCAHPPHPDTDTLEQLIDDGLADEEAGRLHALIERHRNSLPISPNQIGAYLVEAGV